VCINRARSGLQFEEVGVRDARQLAAIGQLHAQAAGKVGADNFVAASLQETQRAVGIVMPAAGDPGEIRCFRVVDDEVLWPECGGLSGWRAARCGKYSLHGQTFA